MNLPNDTIVLSVDVDCDSMSETEHDHKIKHNKNRNVALIIIIKFKRIIQISIRKNTYFINFILPQHDGKIKFTIKAINRANTLCLKSSNIAIFQGYD